MNKEKVKELIKKTFEALNKILKRRHLKEGFSHFYKSIYEGKEIEKYKKDISTLDKRNLLKNTYKQVLEKMGFEEVFPFFAEIIDSVPESYLDYEIGINTESAGDLITDLLQGKDALSNNEIGNLINVIKGVGIPAIEKYASGKEKMGKETAKFGSAAINKNVSDYFSSKEERKSPVRKISSPDRKMIEVKTPAVVLESENNTVAIQRLFKISLASNSKLFGLASKIGAATSGTSKTNLSNRLANIMANASSYEQAKKVAEKKNIKIDFSKNEYEEFVNSWAQAKKERKYARRSSENAT